MTAVTLADAVHVQLDRAHVEQAAQAEVIADCVLAGVVPDAAMRARYRELVRRVKALNVRFLAAKAARYNDERVGA